MTTPNRRARGFAAVLAVMLAACGGSASPPFHSMPSLHPGEGRNDCDSGIDRAVCAVAWQLALRDHHLDRSGRYVYVASAGTNRYAVDVTLANGATHRFTVDGLLSGKDAVVWSWTEPKDYSFTAEFGVFGPLAGRFKVDVRDGNEIRARRIAGPGPKMKSVPTIGELQKQAEDAVAQGGSVAVQLATDGRPTFIYIDPIPNAIDDELTTYILRFRTVGGAAA